MQRYLLRVAFNGHKFNGAQTCAKRTPPHLWSKEHIEHSLNFVQGAIEVMTYTLRPYNEVIAQLGSRTDTGVHATNMPLTLDLQKPPEAKNVYFDPKVITNRLNIALSDRNLDIRVLKTEAVNGNFKARSASTRSYLYRFAVFNKEKAEKMTNSPYFHIYPKPKNKTTRRYRQRLPVSDQPFFTEIHNEFDPEKAEAMLQMLIGIHDFKAFSCKDAREQRLRAVGESEYKWHTMPEDYFHRKIDEVTFRKIDPPMSAKVQPIYDYFDFYEFTISSTSFYRSQIRRIAKIMFQVAQGQMTLDQVDQMLKGQIKEWPGNLNLAQPYGLYLTSVEYDDEFICDATDDVTKLPLMPKPDYEGTPIEWETVRHLMPFIFKK